MSKLLNYITGKGGGCYRGMCNSLCNNKNLEVWNNRREGNQRSKAALENKQEPIHFLYIFWSLGPGKDKT